MTAIIFEILVFFIYAALIAGLIKPSLIMRWSKNPTRLKVLGLWLVSLIIVPILAVIIIDDEDLTEDKIEIAAENIKNENYSDAINSLSEIKSDDPLYSEARVLINEADSLNKIVLEKERLIKEAEEEKTAEEEKLKLKEQLKRELASINEGIDFTSYRGTVDAIKMEIVFFGSWAKIIKKGEDSDDPEMQKLAEQLKAKVINIQEKEFPKLRKDYAEVIAEIMWEHDIYVTPSGNGNRYLNFTGGIFSANKNKKDFQEQLKDIPTMFRFKQTRYRWYKGADEYTYYTTYEGKDSDLVELNNTFL
ncbi:hypothetical protein [Zunongwangia pacifica]|uniref:Uncharacterized protein n=1 Tax=Zunongwangia pacifica TaxID=2911062 RepID=A0A9X2CLX3_9FLAO|nr:hypothetical protein [Zunongwangia pacifica]MCL6218925.1 hypothetical protein [Zunongwangia pacifica]